MFVHTIYLNLTKLSQNKVIVMKETRQLNDAVRPPKINYTKVKQAGFDGITDFLMGWREDMKDGFSWKLNDSFTSEDTFNHFFTNRFLENSTNLNISSCGKFEDQTNVTNEFYITEGICAIIENFTEEITIRTNIEVEVFLIDPAVDQVYLKFQTVDQIIAKGDFSSRSYEVTIHEEKILKKDNCFDYDLETNSSHEKCMFRVLKEEMSKKTGCVFPWACQIHTCTAITMCPEKIRNVSRNGTKPLFKMIKDIANNKHNFTRCKQPCLKTLYQVTLLGEFPAYQDYHWIRNFILLENKILTIPNQYNVWNIKLNHNQTAVVIW